MKQKKVKTHPDSWQAYSAGCCQQLAQHCTWPCRCPVWPWWQPSTWWTAACPRTGPWRPCLPSPCSTAITCHRNRLSPHVVSLVMFCLLSCLPSCHVFPPVMSSPLSCLLSHHVFSPVMSPLLSCLPSCHVFSCHVFYPINFSLSCLPPCHVFSPMSPLLSCLPSCHVFSLVMSSLLSCLPCCHVFSPVMSSLLSCLLSRHVSPFVMSSLPSCLPFCHVSPLVMSSLLSCLFSCHVFPLVMSSLPSCLLSRHVSPFVMSSLPSCLLSHHVSPFVMSSLFSTTPTIMYLIECTSGRFHAPCIYLHAMYVVVTVYNSGPCHWYLDAYTYTCGIGWILLTPSLPQVQLGVWSEGDNSL